MIDLSDVLVHEANWFPYVGQDQFGNNEYSGPYLVKCIIEREHFQRSGSDTQDRYKSGHVISYRILLSDESLTVYGEDKRLSVNDKFVIGDDTAYVASIEDVIDMEQDVVLRMVNAETEDEV